MDDDDTVRVRIDFEQEAYPVTGISEIGNPEPGEGFEIPAALWSALRQAQKASEDAQYAVMSYIAERHPFPAIRDWMADNTEEEP